MSVNGIGLAGLPDLSGLTILVVDDTEDALDLLSGYLTACGAHVLAAANGLAALTHLATDAHIDVVVSDLTMPHMDGAQLLRWIRAKEGRRRVPVVALTGYPERYVQTDTRFDAFLEKPVNLDRLCEVVQTMVKNAAGPETISPSLPVIPVSSQNLHCDARCSASGTTGSGGQP